MKPSIPFDFLLNDLPAGIIVKPAIGMFYIYFNGRIVLIFRKTNKNPQFNGIWIATTRDHHHSLKVDVPAVSEFQLEEGIDTAWLLLNHEHDDFESAATKICQLVAYKDPRIGKVTPKSAALFGH